MGGGAEQAGVTATVWVFHGVGANFAGGVFSSRAAAEAWIARHQLEGSLTEYPLDRGVYEWAIETGRFTPRKPEHSTSRFIGGFTTASQEHDHFEGGRNLTSGEAEPGEE